MSRISRIKFNQLTLYKIKVILVCAFLLIAVGCNVVSGESSSTKENIVDKKTISKEEEVDFFNEVELWLNPSMKNNGIDFAKRRKLFFIRLAEKGFIPAKAALLMFKFDNKPVPDISKNREALGMLINAANIGDTSSACAITALMNKVEPLEKLFAYEKYVHIGVKSNHFACLNQMATILRRKDENPLHTTNRVADELELESARNNYYGAIVARRLIAGEEVFSVNKINKILCWAVVGGKIKGSMNDAKIKHAVLSYEFDDPQSEEHKVLLKWGDILGFASTASPNVDECLKYEAKK